MTPRRTATALAVIAGALVTTIPTTPAAAAPAPDPTGWTVTRHDRPARWTVTDRTTAGTPRTAARAARQAAARPAARKRHTQPRVRWTAATTCRPTTPAPKAPEARWIVRPGDTLWLIARCHGVTVEQLAARNGIRGDRLRIGQVLFIPQARP